MKQVYSTIQVLLKNLAAAFLLLAGLTPLSGQGQSITLLSPNGGETWIYYTLKEVSWSGDSLSSMLRLEFSPDGGINWSYLAELPSGPNGGIFPVGVPNYSTTNALLRISDFSNPSVSDVSDAPFTVIVPPINIYQPATGSVVFANTLTYVNWIVYAPGINQLNAEISTDNGLTYIPVAQNLNALMGYTYLVLSDTPAETAILKLYNTQDPSEFCLSTPFTISQVPVYTLTSPSGGEIVNVYSPVTISWTVENSYSDNCDLEFSTDNGETWTFINNATSTGTFGSYVWTTPNLNSEECVIRIRDIYAFTSMDTSAAFTIMPFPETPLCMVTADSLTNYNVIVWEKPASGLIEDFLVYRETSQANVYEVIDTVGYNEEPVVTDFGSNPALRPYRYKVGFMDSENRVFPAGDYHQTIHLTISQGIGGNRNLTWTPYAGFDFSSYNILRKTGSGDYEQIATISSSFSSYTDFDASSENVAYIVAIDRPGICNTSLRDNGYTQVRSNKASLNAVSVAQIPGNAFSIYPVPANDQINIQFGNNAKGNINLTITDVAGRIIISAEHSDIVAGQVLPINTSDYSEGLYLLNIVTYGERIARKFIVQH
jgi:hypothetical protein